MANITQAQTKRPLLKTKLVMPRMRENCIVRERLIHQLNQPVALDGLIQAKVSFIHAPAGYGKTTLVTQWVRQLNCEIAWFSVDASDNNEARFLSYLFAAIGTVQEEIGEAALARLTATHPMMETMDLLAGLLNDLSTAEPLVLVLDDVHLLTDEAVQQVIVFLIQYLPVSLHLVFTSRHQPNPTIALLRAQGKLNEITLGDLRFTPTETEQFLTHTMGVYLHTSHVDQLDEHVEGWVTGLQLVALTLQDNAPLVQAFSGKQRYLVDYLGEQVLHKQSKEMQDFLLKTAVLDRFCAPLCDALLEDSTVSAYDCLINLEQVNLFLIPLDLERQWYRYHHLFAEFLNGRLQRHLSPDEIANLHQRAALWYHQNGYPTEAVDHALNASDYALATELILNASQAILRFGEGRTLRYWIEQLPHHWQTRHPQLRLAYAWSLIHTGDFSQAAIILDAVAPQIDSSSLRGEWSALRARLAVMTRDDTAVNVRFSQQALAYLSPDQHRLRSEISINLGFSYWSQSDWQAAQSAFEAVAQNSQHDPGLWAVLYATFYWGQIHEIQGKLKEAFVIYEQGLETAIQQTTGRDLSPAVGFMHIGMGWLLYEWNRLPEAEAHLRQAVACAERCRYFKMLWYAQGHLAQCLSVVGDEVGMNQMLDALEQQSHADKPSVRRATISLQHNQTTAAEQWVIEQNLSLSDPPEKIRAWIYDYRELVRLRIMQRRLDGVLMVLHLIEEATVASKNTHFLILVLILKAIAMAVLGDMETAVSVMHQAFNLAEPAGYIRVFLDHPDPIMPRILHIIASEGSVHEAYARELLGHWGETAVTTIHPLSSREIEVLQYLAIGLSNREISQQMVVSVNTVKTHIRRLYTKLEVNNRTQAITRARELQLL